MSLHLKKLLKNGKLHDSRRKKIQLQRRIGGDGRDGKTYETKNGNAFKQYSSSALVKQIYKEYLFQRKVSRAGITPEIIHWNPKYKYILMGKLDITLPDYIKKHHKLSKQKQLEIISLFRALDKLNVFHADPNPYNFMLLGKKVYIIDFGFARETTTNENMKYMPSGLLLYLQKIFPQMNFNELEKYSQLINCVK